MLCLFVVHLMMLLGSNSLMIVNHVFERVWKEADIAYSKATFEYFPRGTEKRRPKNLSHKSWCPG
jgi:hypothetical protein